MTTACQLWAPGAAAAAISNLSISLFKALQVVMGDAAVAKFKPNTKDSDGLLQKREDIAYVAVDLCNVGRTRVNLRDELYIQCFKQLQNNPFVLSRLRGWLLLTLYLHAFPPSVVLLPYMKHHLTNSAAVEAAGAGTDVGAGNLSKRVQLQAQQSADSQYAEETKVLASLTGEVCGKCVWHVCM